MSPKKNNPLVDLHFHEDETTNICRVAVSTQGRFSDARIEQVNSPKISLERFLNLTIFYSIIRQAPRRYGLQEMRRQFEHISRP